MVPQTRKPEVWKKEYQLVDVPEVELGGFPKELRARLLTVDQIANLFLVSDTYIRKLVASGLLIPIAQVPGEKTQLFSFIDSVQNMVGHFRDRIERKILALGSGRRR